MFTVTVTLCQHSIATKTVAADNALVACNLTERLMSKLSQAEAVMVERIRTQYKLAGVWFEYQTRRVN